MNTRPLFFAAGHCISAGLTLRPARPPGRRLRTLALLGLMLVSGLAAAQPLIVRDIHFAGNRITQPSTLLRELKVRVGDAYDDERVEASRQAIQDLGLFRSVAVDHETVDSGIELTFTVAEKWYLQAYPRLSANSDGQNSVGAELRWSNLWGLNHSLRMLGRSRDSNDADRGREQSYRARYSAPFLLSDHVGLRGGVSHSVTPFIDPAVYDETLNEAELLATYALGPVNTIGLAAIPIVLTGPRRQRQPGLDPQRRSAVAQPPDRRQRTGSRLRHQLRAGDPTGLSPLS